MTRIEVTITGFDRITDELAIEVAVPPESVAAAREIANVPAGDPDLMGAYPLTEEQVRQIAAVAQIIIDPGQFDYFLEAYATE